MSMDEFIVQMKIVEESLLNYIDNQDDEEKNFSNFIKLVDKNHIRENQHDFIILLRLLISVSKHHYRNANFFDKIERILTQFTPDIKKYYSEQAIFDIFKSDKRILLFLVTHKIITFNKKTLNKFEAAKFEEYFLPEKKIFYGAPSDSTEEFEANRRNGENEHHICQLIRKDDVVEFIKYINQTNFSINWPIEKSIFETNPLFYLTRRLTLIQYAAFYGSIQIIKYLINNNAQLNSSLLIYAIHSKNPEVIALLEEKIEPIVMILI